MTKPHIPEQKSGSSHDAISERCFPRNSEATAVYAEVRQKLLDIKRWQNLASEPGADFKLFNREGQSKSTLPSIGDYIRIKIPGPGNSLGDGYDWVKISEIQESAGEDTPFFAITLKPSQNPQKRDGEVAHFLVAAATNTILVRMEGNCVYTEVHGRNEKPNIHDVSMVDKARNALVATMGIFGLSKIQWKVFTNGLLNS